MRHLALCCLLLSGCGFSLQPEADPAQQQLLQFLEALDLQQQREIFDEEQQLAARACPAAAVARRLHR